METVKKIIHEHGGMVALKADYIRIENEPYMRLMIEAIGPGPRGQDQISVAHYGEQNGDAMRDPEVVFEVSETGHWCPVYFLNDYVPVEQEAIFRDPDTGAVMIRPRLLESLIEFTPTWDMNLREQGFLEAYMRQKEKARCETALCPAPDAL